MIVFVCSFNYGLKKGIKTPGGHVEVHLNTVKGTITELAIFGDFFVNRDIEPLVAGLIGAEHREEALLTRLKALGSQNYFNNITAEELVDAFF